MYMSKMPEIQKYIQEILPQLKGEFVTFMRENSSFSSFPLFIRLANTGQS